MKIETDYEKNLKEKKTKKYAIKEEIKRLKLSRDDAIRNVIRGFDWEIEALKLSQKSHNAKGLNS